MKRRGKLRHFPNNAGIQPGSYYYEAPACNKNHPVKQYYNVMNPHRQTPIASLRRPNDRKYPQRSNGLRSMVGTRNQLYATEAEDLANEDFLHSHLNDNNSVDGKAQNVRNHFIEGQYNEMLQNNLYSIHHPTVPATPTITAYPDNLAFAPIPDIPSDRDKRIRYPKRQPTTVTPAIVTPANAVTVSYSTTNCHHNSPQLPKKKKQRKLKNVELLGADEQHPNHNYGRSERIFVSKLLDGKDQLHAEIENIFDNEFNGRNEHGQADKSHWELRIVPRPIYDP